MTAAVEVLATRRDELPERTRQALDVLVDQVLRFDAMVMDLLELSRLEAGAIDGHVEEVDLADLVRRIVARTSTPAVPIEVQSELDTVADVDKVRIERIVTNLVENAHVHAGGATRVSIEAGIDSDTLHIAVEDAGPGVAAGERTRIFERFARGSASRHRVGTGLGLALVAEHAAALGGAAWVEDRRNGGARFVVQVPAASSTRLGNTR
jgi:signal transduction histidine kinase